MGAKNNMTTEKTAKKIIATVTTLLKETQSLVFREAGAIGKPDEKFNLHLSWRKYRLTRHTTILILSGSGSFYFWR